MIIHGDRHHAGLPHRLFRSPHVTTALFDHLPKRPRRGRFALKRRVNSRRRALGRRQLGKLAAQLQVARRIAARLDRRQQRSESLDQPLPGRPRRRMPGAALQKGVPLSHLRRRVGQRLSRQN